MRKIVLFAVAVMITTGLAANDFGFGVKTQPFKLTKAQKTSSYYTVDQGNMIISLGYGFPNISKSFFKLYEAYDGFSSSGFGPIHAKFEYMVSDRFGVGLVWNSVGSEASFTNDSLGVTYNYGVKYSSNAFNIRFNWHFYNDNNLDMYAGAGIGYKLSKAKWTTNDPNFEIPLNTTGLFPLGFEVTAGIRYFFTDMIGVYAEVGAAKSIIQFGVSVKL